MNRPSSMLRTGVAVRLARRLPQLGRYKRVANALWTMRVRPRQSYAQYSEDLMVRELLEDERPRTGTIYVDVGANHPSHLSNTCLLYKEGFRGVLIEPNGELARLLRRFRPEDSVFQIGIAAEPGVASLQVSNTPGLSSFVARDGVQVYRSEEVPVLPLDLALARVGADRIVLLSIDVEGMNSAVLKTAHETLKKTVTLCIEFDDSKELAIYREILPPAFIPVGMTPCNVLYVNRELSNAGSMIDVGEFDGVR